MILVPSARAIACSVHWHLVLCGIGVVAAAADESNRPGNSFAIERTELPTAAPPACIGWDKSWVVHRYSPIDNRWSSWKSPAIDELPKRGAFSKVTAAHAVIVDPLKNYEGWRFDFGQQKWKVIPRSPLDGAAQGGRGHYAPIVVAVVSDRLFLWGENKGPPHGAILDFATNRWHVIPEAPIVRRCATLDTVVGDQVVILGGVGAGAYQSDGAVFNLTDETWEKVPPMPIKRAYGMVITQWRDRVVIAGGRDNAQVATYDLQARDWKFCKAAPLVIGEYPACVSIDDRLLLWSGHLADGALRVNGLLYDFHSAKWEVVPDAPVEGRWCSFSSSYANRAILWGGWKSEDRFQPSAAEFDVDKRTWRRLAEMPGQVPMQLHPGW